MSEKDYDVGYGKPPKEFQFKKGVCPNLKGRGKNSSEDRGAIVEQVLNSTAKIVDGGKRIRKSRIELSIKNYAYSASKGDVASAALLLKILARSKKGGDLGPMVVVVENALPDMPW
jgi:Family of unknown function (DUF5681)